MDTSIAVDNLDRNQRRTLLHSPASCAEDGIKKVRGAGQEDDEEGICLG